MFCYAKQGRRADQVREIKRRRRHNRPCIPSDLLPALLVALLVLRLQEFLRVIPRGFVVSEHIRSFLLVVREVCERSPGELRVVTPRFFVGFMV